MLTAVRRQFPTQVFHIDCNSGYTLGDLPLFQQIDQFGLAMIEQPLPHDDLLDHAALQRQIRTPVCLDESIAHPRHVRQALAQRSCQLVNIKPGRVGGLTNAIEIHRLCAEAGIPCWVGGMLESALGASLCVSLAMLDNFTYPADIFPSSRFYHEDLCERPLELIRLPDGTPGVVAEPSPEPHPDRLRRLCVQSADLR
jgi:O-succinylbenzoate synthase